MKIIAGISAFLLVLQFSHIAFAQVNSQSDAPLATIPLESDEQRDLAIERRLRQIFDEFGNLRTIGIEVNAGVVVLSGRASDNTTHRKAEAFAGRVEGVVAVRNDIEHLASIEKQLEPAINRFGTRLQRLIEKLPLIGIAIAIFLAFLAIGWWVSRLQSPWNRITPNSFVANLVRQVVLLGFIGAGIAVALDVLGAVALLGTILGAAGIFGLAVGFAVRDTIENYVASIMLSVRQPFRPNDHIEIGEHQGYVTRLTSRATILMTHDGNHVRIPNAQVFKGVIINYSRNPERRFQFRLGVGADGNLRDALALGVGTLKELAFVVEEPEPLGWIEEIGDSNVVLWFGAWMNQQSSEFAKARSEAIRLTKKALEDAGFSLPEPIYRLRFDGSFPSSDGVVPQMPPSPASPGNASESATVGDTARQTAVEDKIAAEHMMENSENLLDPGAPTE